MTHIKSTSPHAMQKPMDGSDLIIIIILFALCHHHGRDIRISVFLLFFDW